MAVRATAPGDEVPRPARGPRAVPEAGTIIRPGDDIVPYQHVAPSDVDPEGWAASPDALATLRFASQGPARQVSGQESANTLYAEPYHEV